MIAVSEAKQKIIDALRALPPVQMALAEAAGKTLASDVYALYDIPAFPQSAMDGYAFAFSEWKPGMSLQVDGELRAGNPIQVRAARGKAYRIFTGAPVPSGTDTVIMQEKIRIEGDVLSLQDEQLRAGANVRPRGSEIKSGELAMGRDKLLTPAAIGFLAGIGVNEVAVYPGPRVSLIVTGDELQESGKQLQYGQVYESNSYTLIAALQQLGIGSVQVHRVKDELSALSDILQLSLTQADLVLLTGGVSVGKYDFVTQAAARCGIETIFHKVKQKPGKPLFFGMKNNQPVFGLPGNPSSVLTCFYEYVLDAIGVLTGRNLSLPVVYAPITSTYRKKAGLTHFLKAHYNGANATILDAQESYRMRSFAEANCLIKVEEGVECCKEGAVVEVHLMGMG